MTVLPRYHVLHARRALEPEPRTPRSALDYTSTTVVGLVLAAALIALAIGLGLAPPPSAHTTPAPTAPAKPALVSVAYTTPAALTSRTTTIWLGAQPVTVAFWVNSTYAGTPHARIHNNGPHPIRVAVLSVNGMSDAGRYLSPGHSQTLARGWVTVAGHTNTARYGVVDQATGRYGTTTLTLGGGYAPVLHTSMVANVQAAAGGLAADGGYGPLTDARLRYIRSHWQALPWTVASVQRAYGVSGDGIWGGQTENAYQQLRASMFGRY